MKLKNNDTMYGAIPAYKPPASTDNGVVDDEQARRTQQSEEQNLERLQIYGQACGLLYLMVILCGMTAQWGVRDTLVDFDSISNTIDNITEFPIFFRFGMMVDVCMCCCDAGVAVLLGAILIHAGANPVLAITASVFRFLQTGITAMNLMHMFVASILSDPNYYFADVIGSSSLQHREGGDGSSTHAHDIAYMFLVVHKYGYLLALSKYRYCCCCCCWCSLWYLLVGVRACVYIQASCTNLSHNFARSFPLYT